MMIGGVVSSTTTVALQVACVATITVPSRFWSDCSFVTSTCNGICYKRNVNYCITIVRCRTTPKGGAVPHSTAADVQGK